MALSANSVFEVRTAGNDTNGGGFVTGASGTDYSQQNSAQYALTNGHYVSGSTILTASASADMIGSIAYIAGGTGSMTGNWYQITGQSLGVSLTLDRSTGLVAGTGMTINIGGALLSPGIAMSLAQSSGNIIFIKNDGTYSITSATTNIAGGCIGSSGGNAIYIQGYSSTRSLGNSDTGPTIQSNVSTATLVTTTASTIDNIAFDGNSQTAARLTSGTLTFFGCMFKNFNTATSGTCIFINCQATTNSAAVFNGSSCYQCEAYANTATPFIPGQLLGCYGCISSGNTGASTDGFNLSAAETVAINCIAISNGRDGFRATSTTSTIMNCHAESNTGFGFTVSGSAKVFRNNSYYNNTGGTVSSSGSVANVGSIAVTAGSVFTNAAGNVFSLNATTNQGSLLRATANPSTFPRGLTPNYRDIGAAQHQDSGGSAGMLFIPNVEGT